MANILTVYFSIKGQTIGPGMKIVNPEKGNTAAAAEYIHDAVGGCIFEIETVKTYLTDHMEMVYEAKEEIEKGTRVELKSFPEDFQKYDTVFLGYPNWWNTLPMPVVTFLEHFDWTGKRIIPFCTNEGSGLGKSVDVIRRICSGADVDDGISFQGSKVRESGKKITEWSKSRL